MKSLKSILEASIKIEHDTRNCTFRTNGGELCYFDEAITIGGFENCIEIQTLVVSNRRNGIGTTLVNACKDYADRVKKDIVLCASPLTDVISEDNLIDFYMKLGFQHIDGKPKSILKYSHK